VIEVSLMIFHLVVKSLGLARVVIQKLNFRACLCKSLETKNFDEFSVDHHVEGDDQAEEVGSCEETRTK